MKQHTNLRDATTLLAVATMILVSPTVGAETFVFDDGKTHVISDATHQWDNITVRNNTKLVIAQGAKIAGPRLETQVADGQWVLLGGAVNAYDNSSVSIEGGDIGGGVAGGEVLLFDTARATISGGSFGPGWACGNVYATAHSEVNISGGNFGGPDGASGEVSALDDAVVRISGGQFGGAYLAGSEWSGRLQAFHNSKVYVSGGIFGGAGNYSGCIYLYDETELRVSGGSFGGEGAVSGAIWAQYSDHATVRISGGTFGSLPPEPPTVGFLVLGSHATATVSGGQWRAGVLIADSCCSVLKIEGCEFNYPFGQFEIEWGGLISGTLSSGEAINANIAWNNGAAIYLIEDCPSQ